MVRKSKKNTESFIKTTPNFLQTTGAKTGCDSTFLILGGGKGYVFVLGEGGENLEIRGCLHTFRSDW